MSKRLFVILIALAMFAGVGGTHPAARRDQSTEPLEVSVPVFPEDVAPGYEVVLNCLISIDPSGRVTDVLAFAACTRYPERAGAPAEFKRAARDALLRWKYPEASVSRQAGVTVSFLYRYPDSYRETARFILPNHLEVFREMPRRKPAQ